MMLGRTPGNIVAIRPMKDGVIADFEVTEAMLRHFIRKVHNRRTLVRPRIIVSRAIRHHPGGKTGRARESAEIRRGQRGFSHRRAHGGGHWRQLPITEPTCNMVVDIGGGTTEVAVISLAGIVYSKSVRVAATRWTRPSPAHQTQIQSAHRRTHRGNHQDNHWHAPIPTDKVDTIEVKGRDLMTGIPKIWPSIRKRCASITNRSTPSWRRLRSPWSRRPRSLPPTLWTVGSC
jgi:rod shape-determining protein MreB